MIHHLKKMVQMNRSKVEKAGLGEEEMAEAQGEGQPQEIPDISALEARLNDTREAYLNLPEDAHYSQKQQAASEFLGALKEHRASAGMSDHKIFPGSGAAPKESPAPAPSAPAERAPKTDEELAAVSEKYGIKQVPKLGRGRRNTEMVSTKNPTRSEQDKEGFVDALLEDHRFQHTPVTEDDDMNKSAKQKIKKTAQQNKKAHFPKKGADTSGNPEKTETAGSPSKWVGLKKMMKKKSKKHTQDTEAE